MFRCHFEPFHPKNQATIPLQKNVLLKISVIFYFLNEGMFIKNVWLQVGHSFEGLVTIGTLISLHFDVLVNVMPLEV